MKTSFVIVTAGLLMVAAPAVTQTAEPAPPPAPVSSGPDRTTNDNNTTASDGFRFRQEVRRQCLTIGSVAGANRAGSNGVYMQSKGGRIVRLEMSAPCDALDAAQKISVRGPDLGVCVGEPATLLVKTAAGTKRCAVRQVILPTKAELAELGAATRR